MKNHFFFNVLFFCVSSLVIFAEEVTNKTYVDYPFSVQFLENKIIFKEEKDDGNTTIAREGQFVIEYECTIPFLHINYDDGKYEKLLVIKNDNVCALLSDKKLIFLGTASSFNQREGYLPPSIVTATSFLTEKDKNYSSENLSKNPHLETPWVEGAAGQGIGEKLYIKNTIATELYISLGFVSFYRPYLYTMNSRPKELKFSVDGKFSLVQHLSDTPNYQKIVFPEQVKYDDILVIEILSVYEGTRYQDTCINNIIIKKW